ncbi:RcnB family protein [Acinetobacter sp. ANC 5414]|uniref:RcnB family protein n=1 Tax=Acinetobacter sp. ANC 5414 TaxID=2731251 RepID=UPI00148FAC10|nr:RcnB family protein [Acinetobacter sp. ANC 5414]NNH00740.1 RcnB family protein [Acinetobacter sp. ANC 5414]
MNTLIKAIVLSLSTALVAAPAMAAPQDHHSQPHNQQHNQPPAQNHHKAPVQQHHNAVHKKAVNPSHDWRVGQKVPSQYHGKSYKVDHTKYKKLSKPGKNQQWIKVNGDYVLMNVMSHNIIKIIGG